MSLTNGKQPQGQARGTFIDPALARKGGVIPPTGIACPFSDIPLSSFFFAFIHVPARGLLRKRDKKGFTLLELVLAIGIFASAMAAILLLFINCAILDNANRNKSIAISHAESAMEYIRSQSFSTNQNHLCSSGNPVPWDVTQTLLNPPNTQANLIALTSETINITTTQSCCSKDPLDRLDVTVNVAWSDRGQRSRNLALGTSISK